jgi:hypothetical protein
MPVAKTEQARVEMNRAQWEGIAKEVAETPHDIAGVILEETNLVNVVAAKIVGMGQRPTTVHLVHASGEIHKLGVERR